MEVGDIWPWLIPPLVLIAGGAAVYFGRRLRTFGREVNAARARELFRLQRERLEAQFLRAAGATGKPRGLRWVDCEWEDPVTFVRDRATGHLAAFVGVTIQFEAIPGSDMEGLPAVGNLKNASAVFFFHGGHWQTVGKAVFNLNPDEALRHLHNQYEPLT
ncbi:MAG: hypothetical protein L0Y71_07860 [Gemmataceae bacterium]|nr:hypothetical protein [Gemmataceae bacterium]